MLLYPNRAVFTLFSNEMNWTFHWNTGQWSYQARIDDWSHTHDLFYFSLFVSAFFCSTKQKFKLCSTIFSMVCLSFAWLSPVFDNRLLKALREMSPPLWGYVTTSNLYYLCICYYTLPSGNIKHSFSLSLSLLCAISILRNHEEGLGKRRSSKDIFTSNI